jgi:hypothetical protein
MKLMHSSTIALLLVLTAPLAGASAYAAAGVEGSSRDSQVLRLDDPQGDTWSYTDASDYVQEARPTADLLRATIRHGERAVGVRLVFDNLRRRGTMWYRIDVRTPGETSWFIVEAKRGEYGGVAYQDLDGEWVRVDGLTHRIDYSADTMTFRVSRQLLDDPPWVRVRVRSELGIPDGTFYTDNPMNTGPRAAFTARVPAPPDAARSTHSGPLV